MAGRALTPMATGLAALLLVAGTSAGSGGDSSGSAPRPRPSPSVSPRPKPSPSPARRTFTDDDLPASAAAAEKRREKAKEGASPEPEVEDAVVKQAEDAQRAERDRETEEQRRLEQQTEAEWRSKASAARERVKSAEGAVTALQEELRRLAGEIQMSTDTYVILPLQEKSRKAEADLQAAQGEVAAAKKALADFEEEARRAGVSPHWLRER